MNWLDVAVLVIAAASIFCGLRAGLIRSLCSMAGVLIALAIAPRLSAVIAEQFASSPGNQSVISAGAYVAVFLIITLAASFAGSFLSKLAAAMFLGWVDRLGGAVFGLATGFLEGLALIAVLAMLAFTIPGQSGGALASALVGSRLVPYYLDARSAIPAEAKAFIPGDFSRALDELEMKRAGGGKS